MTTKRELQGLLLYTVSHKAQNSLSSIPASRACPGWFIGEGILLGWAVKLSRRSFEWGVRRSDVIVYMSS